MRLMSVDSASQNTEFNNSSTSPRRLSNPDSGFLSNGWTLEHKTY